MSKEHISSQYESDLNQISARVMEMGKLVETQFRRAIDALAHLSLETSAEVIETERRVNAMEIQIDRDLASIIALRQPTARDLRLLIAISKTTTDLERVGDEAKKIAHKVQAILDKKHPTITLPASELRVASDLALELLREAVEAFSAQDTAAALRIFKKDEVINEEFFGFVRKLITYMMEDPRTISASLDLLFVAKAIERVGDHAKNIAEFIIYIVEGTDVRHTTMAEIEAAIE